tara:strand:+ start:96 stop:479 length:384 start_codon:yes stop_codon:yes gene_type:complete
MEEINNFIEKVVKNETDTLAIDFDGVIHDHNLGFHDGTVYGNPIPGAIEAIKKLSKKYKIVIFTCKANPKRPLIKGKTGPELIWEWLEKYDLKSCVKDVTYDKINALYYIDDKAISFNNWDSTLKHL